MPRDHKIGFDDDAFARAVENQELIVYYQPMMDLASKRIVRAEALVRWNRPGDGLIGPDQFIPLAEKSGAISALTRTVLINAFRDFSRLQATLPELTLAVNLSPVMLTHLDLPERIDELLKAHAFDPRRLTLEITEHRSLDDFPLTSDILTRLRLMGISLALDDFGRGYSSLHQLYRLPFAELKIDKAFVMEAAKNPKAAAIVRSAIEMGKSVDLRVVAEGIENQQTLDWLAEIGCDVGQGYFVGPPLACARFARWLERVDPRVPAYPAGAAMRTITARQG